MNQKGAPRIRGAPFLSCQLRAECGAGNRDVAGLRSLGSLFDSELDLLTFHQVAVTIALNGREMDENVLSAFAFDEAKAFGAIEPLDRTDNSFRHVLPPMAI